VRIFQEGTFLLDLSSVCQAQRGLFCNVPGKHEHLEITPGDCETFYSEREQLKDAVEAGA
jgi:hypothetical protein